MNNENTVAPAPASGADGLRTLIIGAGVAGLTLAALMQQRGESPTIIERERSPTGQGYMLGLFPLGGRVLHGLGLHQRYLSRSVGMRQYQIGTGQGQLVRQYSLDQVTRRFGPIRGIGRDELVALLLEEVGVSNVVAGCTVTRLEHQADAVDVTFSDGSSRGFDVVVAADGMHSDTRDMILDDSEYRYLDTGWGGWVFWADPELASRDSYTEYWGAGRFLGLYPTRDRLGLFIGGPTDRAQAMGIGAFAERMSARMKQPVAALQQLDATSGDSFFWRFHDCRTTHWRKGRVVLLGDAAVGFLPTAGVGASMAMESAAALNDELSRTDAAHVEQALTLYEKRHRDRVERAQTSSRQLGKLMFMESQPLTWLRNRLLRLYTVEQLVKSIADIMEEPI